MVGDDRTGTVPALLADARKGDAGARLEADVRATLGRQCSAGVREGPARHDLSFNRAQGTTARDAAIVACSCATVQGAAGAAMLTTLSAAGCTHRTRSARHAASAQRNRRSRRRPPRIFHVQVVPARQHRSSPCGSRRRARGAAARANTAAPDRRRSPASGIRCRRSGRAPALRSCAHRSAGSGADRCSRRSRPRPRAMPRSTSRRATGSLRCRWPACARAPRPSRSGNTRSYLPGSARTRGDRVAQALRGALGRLRPARPALRSRPAARSAAGSAAASMLAMPRAHRMPEQREALPAQRIGDVEHRVHGAGEGVVRARRQMRAGAVAGQVRARPGRCRADARPAARSWRRCRASHAAPARAARRRCRRAGRSRRPNGVSSDEFAQGRVVAASVAACAGRHCCGESRPARRRGAARR